MSQSVIAFPQEKTTSLLDYLQPLLTRKSITPNDAGCQQFIAKQLTALGFSCYHFNCNGVENLVASIGSGNTRIAFAGHTDVVPSGAEKLWHAPPFAGQIIDDFVIGRGVADMKGGIAAMLSAIKKCCASFNLTKNTLYFLITSDEEGEAEFGTKAIMAYLKSKNKLPHFCIIGEPTASMQTGDVIKVGRRGAISGEVIIQGQQGHVAYPKQSDNAAHAAAKISNCLTELVWDQGCEDFPGTSLQITAIDTGKWTDNIIPGSSKIAFNVRYSHKQSEQQVKNIISAKLAKFNEKANIRWLRPCQAYFTSTQAFNGVSLVTEVEKAIFNVCHRFPRLSTSGGTSDGRFIAQGNCQVVELGVPNTSIHQINEKVRLKDLYTLESIYIDLLSRIMS